MNKATLLFKAGTVLLFAVALLLVLLAIHGSETAGAERKASSIALYLQEGENSAALITGGGEDSVSIEFELTNYNESDPADRCVLISTLYMTTEGDGGNWNFSFPNAVGGGPFYIYKYPGGGELPFYKYVVKGDGTPEPVMLEVSHLNNQFPWNASDAINLNLRGQDYSLDSEPEDDEELERFLDKYLGNSSKHNVTYLLADGKHPTTSYNHQKNYPISVVEPNLQWQLLVEETVELIPGREHRIPVTVFNHWYAGLPDVVVEAELKASSSLNHSLRAQAPHEIGEVFQMGESYEELGLLVTISPVQETALAEAYELEISSLFVGCNLLTTTVHVTILNTHGLYLNVSGPEELIAGVDGGPTVFSFQMTNAGNLTDSFDLEVELGDPGTRATSTDPYWSRELTPSGEVEVAAGETVNLTLSLTPTLNNSKIPAGRYPVILKASSRNDVNKTDRAAVVIRMPQLFDPLVEYPQTQELEYLRAGTTTELWFRVTNNGSLEDSFVLDISLFHETEGVVATLDNPVAWDLSVRELGSEIPLEGDLLQPLGPGNTSEVLVSVTTPPGTSLGDYTLEFSIRSGGTGGRTAKATAPCALALPDLFMGTGDVEVLEKDRTPLEWFEELPEGETIIIKATIHLNGSFGSEVEVGFYYKSAQAFELIGSKTVSFGDEFGPDVTRTVELTWKGKRTETIDFFENIQVRVDPDNKITESNENNNMDSAGAWFVETKDEGGLGGPAPSGFELVVLVVVLLPALVWHSKKRREG